MNTSNAKVWAQRQKEREKSLRQLNKGKPKEIVKRSYTRIYATILIAALGLSLAAFGTYFYRQRAAEPALEMTGTIITVKAGGDFQAALNRAKSGDTIVL